MFTATLKSAVLRTVTIYCLMYYCNFNIIHCSYDYNLRIITLLFTCSMMRGVYFTDRLKSGSFDRHGQFLHIHPFMPQQPHLFVNSARITRQAAVRAHYPVAGNNN